MAKRVTAEVKRLAVEEYRKGRTLDELAEAADVDARTVARWVREAAAPVAPPIAPAPEAEIAALSAEEPEPDPNDSLEYTRYVRRQMLRDAKTAREIGNPTAVGRLLNAAAGLSNTIARLEKAERENAHTLNVTHDDLEAARDELRAWIKGLSERPLTCARCGRELAIEMAEKGETK